MIKQASSSSTPVNKTTTSSASTGTISITTNGQKKTTGTNEGSDIGIMSQLLRISSTITQQTPPVQPQWLQPSAKWKSTFPPEGFSQQENQSVWHQYETVLVSDLDNIRRGFREFSFLGTKWRLNIQTKPKDKSTLSIYLYNVDIEQKKKLSHEVHTKIAFYVYNLEKKTKTLMQAFNIKWLEEKAWGFTSFANINQLKAKENHLIDESNNTITFCCTIISNPEENSTPTKNWNETSIKFLALLDNNIPTVPFLFKSTDFYAVKNGTVTCLLQFYGRTQSESNDVGHSLFEGESICKQLQPSSNL